MKQLKILFTILFLLTFGISFAQSDSIVSNIKDKISFGTNLSSFIPFDFTFKDGFSFPTAFIIKNERNLFSIAPIWWIDKNINANFFKGGIFSYNFFPNKRQKRINFNFIYDLLYTFDINYWERFMNYTPTTQYNISFKSKVASLKNQIGYGFYLNVYKGFYINQSMSIGVEFYNYKSKTKVKDYPNLSTEYSSGNIFSNSNACGFLKIGIGYTFEK